MPELPEVETVRRGLDPVMTGQVIARAEVNRPDLRWPFPENMADRLTGQRVLGLRRRSKYILVDLSSDETLIIHLGMSGRTQISGAEVGGFYHEHPPQAKHDHVVLNFQNGARVTFNDARRFGAMDLAQTQSVQDHWLLKDIGPEPLGNDFHEDYLAARLSTRNSPIKTALLDQRVVAGLGNIYVCEVLHRAGISPLRKANRISKDRLSRIVPLVREVLNDAITSGGSSLKDYRQADGELGYFQHSFRVYDREGDPCVTENCTGQVKRVVQSGRSSFYCPTCQR